MSTLNREFYCREPDVVARELLGKSLATRRCSGIIVETEAYFGGDDPASRAYRGKKTYNSPMFELPGTLFIYMVHGWWLLNISAHIEGAVGAVLIRALEPVNGLEYMRLNRGLDDLTSLTSGPGKLTKSLGITKEFHGFDVVSGDELTVTWGWTHRFTVGSSHRVGVTRDLPEPLRFYVEGNIFVSR